MTGLAVGRSACTGALLWVAFILPSTALHAQEDFSDRLDERLTFGTASDSVRARLSGTFDLEGYYMSQEEPGLIFADGNTFLNPRLSLFLDVQAGPYLYAFLQARADDGFDPGEGGAHVRADEYVVRLTPWNDARLNVQLGEVCHGCG